jgi:hypothetical protein
MADQQKRLGQGLIRRGPAGAYAPGWDETLGQNTLQGQTDGQTDLPFQKGGPVPRSVMAHHPMALPVLHTTIVIAAKPKKSDKKPEKKNLGGPPRKPQAIPPVAGPGNGERPRPHGRVQVPRGTGAAIKGKRFGGVY